MTEWVRKLSCQEQGFLQQFRPFQYSIQSSSPVESRSTDSDSPGWFEASLILPSMQVVVEDHELSSEEDSNEESVPTTQFLGYLKYLLALIVIWQFAFKASNAAITNLLHFLRRFVAVVGQAFLCNPI